MLYSLTTPYMSFSGTILFPYRRTKEGNLIDTHYFFFFLRETKMEVSFKMM